MFYGVKESDAVRYALVVADYLGFSRKQKRRVGSKVRKLMENET
jgi:hypothetical protein